MWLATKGGNEMNQVLESLASTLEKLRNEINEREYSVRTEKAKAAEQELKKRSKVYEEFLF